MDRLGDSGSAQIVIINGIAADTASLLAAEAAFFILTTRRRCSVYPEKSLTDFPASNPIPNSYLPLVAQNAHPLLQTVPAANAFS